MGLNAPKNMRASEFVSFMGKNKDIWGNHRKISEKHVSSVDPDFKSSATSIKGPETQWFTKVFGFVPLGEWFDVWPITISEHINLLHCLREICDKEQTYQVLLVALFKSIGPESHHHHNNNHRRFRKGFLSLVCPSDLFTDVLIGFHWFSRPRHVRTPLLCAKRWNSAKRSWAETKHKQRYTKTHVKHIKQVMW